jgi:hypothetical protein
LLEVDFVLTSSPQLKIIYQIEFQTLQILRYGLRHDGARRNVSHPLLATFHN